MDEFEDFLRSAREVIEQFRDLLSLVQEGQITPNEAIRRAEEKFNLYTEEHFAESWAQKHRDGNAGLPRGYNHVECCRTGAELFALESAVYAIAAEQFLSLNAISEAQTEYVNACSILDRADRLMGELVWYRRWFSPASIRGARFVSIEDLRSILRGVRIGLQRTAEELRDAKTDYIDTQIEDVNNIVRTTVFAIYRSVDGIVPNVSIGSLWKQTDRLIQFQLEVAGQPSSKAVLRAMESVSVSTSVLLLSRAAMEQASRSRRRNLIYRARSAITDSYFFRRRRRIVSLWSPVKWVVGTLRRTPAPGWAALLPQGRDLIEIRKNSQKKLTELEK